MTSDFFAAILYMMMEEIEEVGDADTDVLSPLMLVLLRSPQQFLDVLGDLLSFTDDVFSAGQTGVRLTLVIIQLRYRAALSHPAAAAQTTSSAKAARREDVIMRRQG